MDGKHASTEIFYAEAARPRVYRDLNQVLILALRFRLVSRLFYEIGDGA